MQLTNEQLEILFRAKILSLDGNGQVLDAWAEPEADALAEHGWLERRQEPNGDLSWWWTQAAEHALDINQLIQVHRGTAELMPPLAMRVVGVLRELVYRFSKVNGAVHQHLADLEQRGEGVSDGDFVGVAGPQLQSGVREAANNIEFDSDLIFERCHGPQHRITGRRGSRSRSTPPNDRRVAQHLWGARAQNPGFRGSDE